MDFWSFSVKLYGINTFTAASFGLINPLIIKQNGNRLTSGHAVVQKRSGKKKHFPGKKRSNASCQSTRKAEGGQTIFTLTGSLIKKIENFLNSVIKFFEQHRPQRFFHKNLILELNMVNRVIFLDSDAEFSHVLSRKPLLLPLD